MTIEEMYALPVDQYGWRRLPTGDDVTLGYGVKLGDDVTLGYGVKLGDDVTLGNRVKLGDDVTLGNRVKLGDDVTLGNRVKLGNGVTLGYGVKLGNDVKLGYDVTLGDDGTKFDWSPLQIQGSRHLLYVAGPNIIGVGCERHDAEWWSEHYGAVGRKEKYTPSQIAEYRNWLDIAMEWQKKLPKLLPSTSDSQEQK